MFEDFFIVRLQASLDLFHIFLGRQAFGANATF
jgi:hypothetical protein